LLDVLLLYSLLILIRYLFPHLFITIFHCFSVKKGAFLDQGQVSFQIPPFLSEIQILSWVCFWVCDSVLYSAQKGGLCCFVLFSFVFVCVAVAVFFVFGLWVEDSGNETSIIVDGSCSDQCKNQGEGRGVVFVKQGTTEICPFGSFCCFFFMSNLLHHVLLIVIGCFCRPNPIAFFFQLIFMLFTLHSLYEAQTKFQALYLRFYI
jgi:hypothetical protein